MKKIILLILLCGQVCPFNFSTQPTGQDKMVDKIIVNEDVSLAKTYAEKMEISAQNKAKIHEAANEAEIAASESSFTTKEKIIMFIGAITIAFGIYAGYQSFQDYQDYKDDSCLNTNENAGRDTLFNAGVSLFCIGFGSRGFYWGFGKYPSHKRADNLRNIAIIVNKAKTK